MPLEPMKVEDDLPKPEHFFDSLTDLMDQFLGKLDPDKHKEQRRAMINQIRSDMEMMDLAMIDQLAELDDPEDFDAIKDATYGEDNPEDRGM